MPGTRPGMTMIASVARRRHRRWTQPHGLLRLQRADVERRSCNQEKADEVDHIGLRRRDRPPHKFSDRCCRTGPFFHAGGFLESVKIWKGKYTGRTIRAPSAPGPAPAGATCGAR